MSVGNLSRISWEFVIGRTVDVHGEGVAKCERVTHVSVFTLPRGYRIGLWHFAARARRRALHLGTSGPRVSHYGISARPRTVCRSDLDPRLANGSRPAPWSVGGRAPGW